MFNAVVTEFKNIKITSKETVHFDVSKICVRNGNKDIEVKDIKADDNFTNLILKEELNIKNECLVLYKDYSVQAIYREIFASDEFNFRFYTEKELGNIYSKDSTLFRVWSPAAENVALLIYKNGDTEIKEEPRKFSMKEENGLWSVTIDEDLEGYFYTYEVKVYGKINEAGDPYAKSAGINGYRSAVIDMPKTNPAGFESDVSPKVDSFTDAIIYETSVRDISTHPDSGVHNKGKFLGLSEENTKSSKGISTALTHIKELGVTHVQLMPMYDISYQSIDERNPVKYNWGYDPQNYNVPEGSYSTDPYNPLSRVLELKALVQTLHRNELCVNMDVVYNHVFNLEKENLEKIFPGYYFRFYDDGTPVNGSACSNDTASEHLMMRRFIVNSVYYWAKEYHLDGFRFDLMGLHDVTTMNAVREKLNTLERPIMVYGEGWVLSTLLKDELKANQQNANKMPHIGQFNDTMRNSVRGSVFILDEKGFASGREGLEDEIKYCVVGCTDYFGSGSALFNTPDQSINYVSAHDNNTLWDKLQLSNPNEDEETLKAMQKLSNAIVLTSQGIPFLHSGEEFCRTKYGDENSFKSPDNINWLDWERKSQYFDVNEYYKGLVRLRREHSAFRMNNVNQIRKHLEFLNNSPKNTVAFMIKNYANNDSWKDVLVIYNGNRGNVNVNLPEGDWNVVVNKHRAGVEILETLNNGPISVEGTSMYVLYR